MDEKSEETSNEIREELVMTAVKFLQNSKVVSSSLETKKSFLLNKGLTAEEIEAAFHRLSSTALPYESSSAELPSQMIITQNSLSSKLRDLLNIILLIGGFSYGARYIWKKYIQEWLFGRVQKEKSPHETLMETCNVLLSTVQSYKDSVAALDSSISKFSDKMDLVTQQLKQANSDDMFGKQELKSEIQSVKGILLSSRSFPGHSRTTLSSPSIPSWQLKTEITEDDTEQRNSGASPDLISKKEDVKTHSSNSSSSEIEMINSESIDTSGEETH